MASTYLTRTPSSTGNRKTFTISVWVKRSELSTNQKIFEASPDGSNRTEITFKTTDELQFYAEVGGVQKYNLKSNAKLRDTNGFYHIVCAVDTTQSTSSNRVKMYINGEQITSLADNVYPDQNFDTLVNFANQINVIGRRNPYSDFYFNGLMSYVALVDGTQELPTIFGETDSVTGQWKIKTSITPSVAWGTNGFLILKNGNSLTDESTNTNNFTLGAGTLTNTLDCPDNVFATLNPLAKPGTANTAGMGNGNTHYNKTSTGVGNNSQANGTLGASSGKYYFELKVNDTVPLLLGVSDINTEYNSNGGSLGDPSVASGVGYYYDGTKYINGVGTSYGDAWTTNDIVGTAFDLDNNYIYFSKNGVWQNSGDPTSGSSGTGGIALTTNITYTPAVMNFNYNSVSSAYLNFGNGYFGTSAVTSAGTAGSTPGTFEYDVPSGYQPLSTKGLNA